MEFNKHELNTITLALARAIVENEKAIKWAKRRAENQRGNPRPGKIAAIAAESADFNALFQKLKGQS